MKNYSNWPLNKSLYKKDPVEAAPDWSKRMETIIYSQMKTEHDEHFHFLILW